MNPLNLSFRTQFLLGFAAVCAILGYALFVQFVDHAEPCPLCIFQRLAFAATGVVFLVGGLHAPRGTKGRKVYGVLAFIAALIGIGIAGKHVTLQLFPPAMPSCGPGWDYLIETNTWLGVLRSVLGAKSDCSVINWSFLGLTMPMWSLLCFVVLAAWALLAGFRKR